MKLRIASDLHLEFADYEFTPHDEDKDTVLILAGDIVTINSLKNYKSFFDKISSQFKKVLLICGNHEYYNSTLSSISTYRTYLTKYKNIKLLDNWSTVIDGVYFIGSTLWTDFNSQNENTMNSAQHNLNDYKVIKVKEDNGEEREILSTDILNAHLLSRKYLFNTVKRFRRVDPNAKIVVISHHAPSVESISENFRSGPLFGLYHSNLHHEISKTKPNLWVHGHTHTSSDYQLEDTRVVCNPRGYSGYEINQRFNDSLIVEI